MTVDTRTPRPGFDDQPALNMVKVHSDPAQVVVNHASFRVELPPVPRPRFADPGRVPAVSGASRRRAPVVWSGKSSPGDPGATRLLQAVRDSAAVDTLTRTAEVPIPDAEEGATRTVPRVDRPGDALPVPAGGGRPPGAPLLPPMRRAEGAYDPRPEDATGPVARYGPAYGTDHAPDRDGDRYEDDRYDGDRYDEEDGEAYAEDSAAHHRHAYYPDRRMNLGVVLLPLRVFLGLVSVYAGMGKLCDPVYFDGGERGSLVRWLTSLDPWPLAEPLRDFALAHPVGAGLGVAFTQVVVGVLTVLGLWQRVAAAFGALLSAALLLTMSWRAVPVYETPDVIYLAAWSPLLIAGAPVYSVDGRLAGEAWRTLGPRAELWELRRRVLRRGAVVAAVVAGLTLLVGSVLGAAVRSSDLITVPGPDDDPTNHLPGRPLPEEPAESGAASAPAEEPEPSEPSESAPPSEPASPSESPTAGPEAEAEPTWESGRAEEEPAPTQGAGEVFQEPAPEPPPVTSAGPTSGSDGSGDDGFGPSGTEDGSSGGSSGGTGGNRNPLGGLLG
ncbi:MULTISPECIES: DoxX family membrane protein [Streptomyces]|uniref:DoxX family membrane protein n=1 Tax=Streptomyces sudanensis TaxID=436397 RepID=A0ABY4TCI5_9ACTN|nr:MULTISPECIES: DoxX family membrane protein [Streptomyces]URN16662.1 DoxX family membrane protein [Streptomyces sudanensis]